jgi:hypothetical protein
VGTTVSQYSLDEPISVYIVNSNASEDEVSVFIGPVKISDGKCGYIAILGSYIIQKNKRDGQSTAALKDEIEHDILATTSVLTRQEVFKTNIGGFFQQNIEITIMVATTMLRWFIRNVFQSTLLSLSLPQYTSRRTTGSSIMEITFTPKMLMHWI